MLEKATMAFSPIEWVHRPLADITSRAKYLDIADVARPAESYRSYVINMVTLSDILLAPNTPKSLLLKKAPDFICGEIPAVGYLSRSAPMESGEMNKGIVLLVKSLTSLYPLPVSFSVFPVDLHQASGILLAVNFTQSQVTLFVFRIMLTSAFFSRLGIFLVGRYDRSQTFFPIFLVICSPISRRFSGMFAHIQYVTKPHRDFHCHLKNLERPAA